ncbi:MAG: sulfatase-like hydrolase/transferase [Planctomycetaceae bacterium]
MRPLLALLSAACLLAPLPAAARPPNIVIFLADDLGYADIGVNGCTDIPTPHIDGIARNGVRFTDGYATHPVCSPSRAGLLSGMYQHRFGFEHNSGPEPFADPNFGLPREIPTLAEKLRAAGYATGMVGKWHVGFREGLRPHERGFDEHYGFLGGSHRYRPDRPRENSIVRNGAVVTDERDYLTDAFAREAAGFVERSRDKPWFLYVAFNAVHSPLEAPAASEARFPHMPAGKRRTYAGMLAALDDAVGRVLAQVRAIGQEEQTLVMLFSDNGGPTQQTTSRNDPLRGTKGQLYEGGIRVPFVMQWQGTIPAGLTFTHPVMGFDCHATALAAAGVAPSAEKPGDGVDLLPFLLGRRAGPPHERLFWRTADRHAVRAGAWKLVQERGGAPQLFNLDDDIGEGRDRAAEQPARLGELQAAFAAWEAQMTPARWVRQDRRTAEPGGRPKAAGRAPRGAAGRASGAER